MLSIEEFGYINFYITTLQLNVGKALIAILMDELFDIMRVEEFCRRIYKIGEVTIFFLFNGNNYIYAAYVKFM